MSMAQQQTSERASEEAGAGAARPECLSGLVEFQEDRNTLALMILTNTLATFVTLGLYRFWARTRLRQYFWHQTVLAGSAFEYHGRGVELFAGFCIIFGAMGTVFGAFYVASVQVFTSDSTLALIGFAPFALVPLLLPVAFYRARGYRLTRTVWRGIHLGQDGSSLDYLGLWLAGLLATLLTLGFAYPWRNVWTARYRVGHTLVGAQRIAFEPRGRDLVVRWLPAWGSGLLLTGALIGGGIWLSLYDAVTDLATDMNTQPVAAPWSDIYAVPPALWALALATSAILFFFAFVHYRVAEFRYFASKTEIGGARFTSDLRTDHVLNILAPGMLGQIGYTIGSAIAVYLLFSFLGDFPQKVMSGGATLLATLALVIFALSIIFVASYGISHILNLGIRAPLMAMVGRSLTIHNPEALDRIEQASDLPLDGTGVRPHEGLAEAYGLGDW